MGEINRQVKEGVQRQGVDESIAYTITTTPWGSTPTNVSVKAYSVVGSVYTDVTATVLSGAASVSGDVITTPLVTGLTEAILYRIEVKFTASGNIFEPYFLIQAER